MSAEFDNDQSHAALPVGNLQKDQMLTLLTLIITERPALLTVADPYDGSLPIHAALRRSGTPLWVVEYLVRQAPETVHGRDGAGNTPLHALCSSRPAPAAVRYLLGRHPDAAAQTNSAGWTPVAVASVTGASVEVIAALLQDHAVESIAHLRFQANHRHPA